MSMGRTVDRATPHNKAFSREARLQMMKDVVRMLSEKVVLKIENAPRFAETYGVKTEEVEAEMMRHLQEGGEK